MGTSSLLVPQLDGTVDGPFSVLAALSKFVVYDSHVSEESHAILEDL